MIKLFAYRVGILLLRECYRVYRDIDQYLLNFGIIWPLAIGLCYGYLAPIGMFPGQDVQMGTELYLGNIILQVGVVTYMQTVSMIRERFKGHLVQYHMSVTSYAATFCARWLFCVGFSFCLLMFYMPMFQLVMGANFQAPHFSWISFSGMLFLVTACMASYMFFGSTLLRHIHMTASLWKRGMEPLLHIGGMWAPAYAVVKTFPSWGPYIKYNPFLYTTEGLRQVVLQSDRFASLATCSMVLISATIVFTSLSYYLLRKKLHAL